MDRSEPTTEKSYVRSKADAAREFRCKNLIAVIEDPVDVRNLGTVIRNANALGVEKVYVVDPRKSLPDDWQEFRQRKSVAKTSVAASKWTFVKRFDNTDDCFNHLEKRGFASIVTSPHVKGKRSIYLDDGDYSAFTKLAVWFGNEARGISERAVERSEMCIAVPMFGIVESLNLGTCSGIVLYEVAKQRRAYQSKFRRADGKRQRVNPKAVVPPLGQ